MLDPTCPQGFAVCSRSMNMHLVSAVLFAAAASPASLLAQWRQIAPPVAPEPRGGASIAANFAGSTFLFGGRRLVGNNQLTDETWRFDGTTWQQLAPATSPAARYGATLVFDVARAVFVLFGGSQTFSPQGTNDTWEFDGVSWTQVLTPALPNAVVYHGSSYDIARSRVVVYGGFADPFSASTSANTYEYDGVTWQQITTAGNPGTLHSVAMCYHAGIGRTVLFGGRNPTTTVSVDTTWLYDGATWAAAPAPGPRPSPRVGAGMVYDAARNVCVLVGGASPQNGSQLADTWEFDGTSWQQQSTTMTAASYFGLAFDLAHQNTVRFSGFTNVPVTPAGETWLYGAFTRSYGTGCAGSNGVPSLVATTPPNLGLSYHLQLGNLAPAIPVTVLALGLTELPGVPLAGIGMPGCAAFVSPDLLVTLPASGSALWATNLPAAPALLGISLFAQGLSIDPGVNAAGLTVSNAVEGMLGH